MFINSETKAAAYLLSHDETGVTYRDAAGQTHKCASHVFFGAHQEAAPGASSRATVPPAEKPARKAARKPARAKAAAKGGEAPKGGQDKPATPVTAKVMVEPLT